MNKKRNLDEVDEVYDRDVSLSKQTSSTDCYLTLLCLNVQAEIYNLEQADWTIDKASDQRMVYVPKDTVIEFMKKVRLTQFSLYYLLRLQEHSDVPIII